MSSDCNKLNAFEVKDPCKPCHLPCLERPRYFCGQLLTEEDLEAEQNYQREKNRLHNRYLHGWGVVCGLKVTCHPKCSSKGNLLIEKGYAIDCCGNDILVCRDEEINLFEKIDEFRPAPEVDKCLKVNLSEVNVCDKGEQHYCLILKYHEEQAKPVTALRRDETGCTVKRCEPSRIREGYKFEVKKCKDCDYDWNNKVGMLKDILIYQFDMPLFKDMNIAKEAMENANIKNSTAYHKSFCEIKGYILSMIKKASVWCDIKIEIESIDFPAGPITNYYQNDLRTAFTSLIAIFEKVKRDYNCLSYLKSCPECSEDDQVVLACVTVEEGVLKHICNFSRRNVPTNQGTLSYSHLKECCPKDPKELGVFQRFKLFPEHVKRPFFMEANMLAASVFSIKKENVHAGMVFNRKIDEVKPILKDSGIQVENVIEYNPYISDLIDPASIPIELEKNSRVNLVTHKDPVTLEDTVLFALPVEPAGEEGIRELRNKHDVLEKELNSLKKAIKKIQK